MTLPVQKKNKRKPGLNRVIKKLINPWTYTQTYTPNIATKLKKKKIKRFVTNGEFIIASIVGTYSSVTLD